MARGQGQALSVGGSHGCGDLRPHPIRARQGAIAGTAGVAYAGLVTSNRLCAYNSLDLQWRQVCWAHIVRNLRAREAAVGTWPAEAMPRWRWQKKCWSSVEVVIAHWGAQPAPQLLLSAAP